MVKSMAFRVLFAIAAYYDLDIDQIDIKTVFSYKLINHLIYMQIPKDLKTNASKEIVYQLLKTLYSLKQASRF